jgi:hypothetical protein
MKRFGYKPSRVQAPPAHEMLRARMKLVEPLPLPDQSAFVSAIIDQGYANSCVGCGMAGGFDQYQRANGIAEPVMPSPTFFYTIARLQEWAGFDPKLIPKLTDSGAEPDLLCQAMKNLGYVSWQSCPYPTEPDVLSDDSAMQRIVNAPLAPALIPRAYDLRGMRWHTIPVGPGAMEMIAQALQHRLGVVFGQFVDSAYCDSRGQVITTINENDPNGGGHFQAAVAVTGRVLKIRSSWGPKSGQYGFYYLDKAVVENPAWMWEIICIDYTAAVPQ